MRKRLSISVFGAVAVTILMTLRVTTAVLSQHVGDTDPITEGFTRFSTVTATGPVANDGGFPAWQITGAGNSSFYGQTINYSNAYLQGWRLTGRMRVVSGSGYAFIGMNPATDRVRFDVAVQTVGADAVVGLFDSSFTQTVKYTVAGAANAWLLLELVYDPVTARASVFIDGVERLTGYQGYSQFLENRGVIFGANGATANFNLVRFQSPATNPAPTLTSLSPSAGVAGGAGVTLTVNGSDFLTGSEVRWNGAARATTVTSSTQVQAAISASDLAVAGTASVTVFNPAPGGGTSNALLFTAGPAMALDKTRLNFGGVTPGAPFLVQTSAQVVRLTQAGSGTVTWTATPSAPWIIVSPASGTGSATLTIGVQAVGGLPAAGTVSGSVAVALSGAGNTVDPIVVNLRTIPTAAVVAPTGVFDTPVDGTAGVTGSIAVTGWALDDVEVTRVRILRDPVAGEGSALVFIGTAVFVDGARSDVAAGNPAAPRHTRAGWGYLMLTNFLPGLGNGTFRLYAIADDPDGHSTTLGSKVITCSNSTATAPFGAIDTPTQGGTVSANVVNFGWVLSRTPYRADPPSGGTVQVVVDGAFLSAVPTGWTSRSDLAALFPASQYPGIVNALGVATFDSTPLANGVHTISWLVTDNLGSASGIGSRYFTVSNGSSLTVDPGTVRSDGSGLTHGVGGHGAHGFTASSISGRRGFDPAAPYRTYRPGPDGVIAIQSEELDRIELSIGAGAGGFARAGGTSQPLPIGARIDPATGTFTWNPGVGFVGAYDFVLGGRDVRIVLHPQASNRVGPQVVIDVPAAASKADPPPLGGGRHKGSSDAIVAGWAADLDSPIDAGVDTVHVWAYPIGGGDPTFLGVAEYGGARPDVAAIYGDRFLKSGFGLRVKRLAPGTYDLAVFAYSTVRGGFAPARVVRVTVR